MDRRRFIGLLGIFAGAGIVPRTLVAGFPSDLTVYDLFLPPEHYWKTTHRFMYDPSALRRIVNLLFSRYRESGLLDLAEGAFFYGYSLWRALEDREEREKVTALIYKMGEEVEKRHPRAPLGFLMQAGATGMHIVTTGILNALHLAPKYRGMLEEGIRRDPQYFYGLLQILMGALYLKAPPFPVAVGDLNKAREYLEKAEVYARRKYGFWYIFYGEYLLLTAGLEATLKLREELVKETSPPNAYLAYIRDSAITDLDRLIERYRKKEYDKYLYSPLLEVARPSGIREREG
jgi:hypothetical protein